MIPKRRKYKKHHKYIPNTKINKKSHLIFGNYGLLSKDWSCLTLPQIESCILTIKRSLKIKGKIWLRVYPHIPVTKKPLEVRMGKGKGSVDTWKTRISPNTVLIELNAISPLIAINALNSVKKKLPFKTVTITK
jgi:large subunit ribosomal protein L16